MSNRHPSILNPHNCLVLLVDLQEPFLRNVEERERVIERSRFIAESAGILNVPILATTQYASRMGTVIPEIASLLPNAALVDKMTFSCACDDATVESIRNFDRRQILIAGVETHICVAQTALDLVQHGYQVHVAADAVSSRGMDRHKLGMEKMRDSGVIPCSAEQAVFELLYESGTEQFKSILKLVKA
jgi:nicotinamidase-related amidase